MTRFDVLNCYSESLTVGWPKCLMLAVMLEHFSIEHCKTVIREDQKVPKEFREKKKVQNSITFQFKNKKDLVCRESIGVGFSIDFAVMSVPLGYRKIPLSNISNRIQ